MMTPGSISTSQNSNDDLMRRSDVLIAPANSQQHPTLSGPSGRIARVSCKSRCADR
jgi:hypothetical protein